jgi:signal transduction histidine kinase
MASNPGDATWPWLRPAGWVTGTLATAAVSALAVRADLAPGGIGAAATAADLAVGLAFAGGAALAPGIWRPRALFAGVGLAWLIGSFVPALELLYLGVLSIAITTFPSGRPRSARDWSLVVLALPVALVVPAKPMLAGLFVAVAISAWAIQRWERAAVWYPVVAATALATAFAGSWVAEVAQPLAFDPPVWRLAFELLLLVVAVGFPVASWAVVRERAQFTDRLLGDDRVAGLEGLAILLAETLGDDSMLGIFRWDPATNRYVGLGGSPLEPDGRTAVVTIDGGGEPLAAVAYGQTGAMTDGAVLTSVIDAVRLTATNERRQAAEREQLDALEAARRRLLATADRERNAIAARLRDEVVSHIEDAAAQLAHLDDPADEAGAREALAVAGRELDASVDEILALIDGVPPATLGNGGLVAAIAQLAARVPSPVSVTATPDAIADVVCETALFYVCSEALANATKHAGAKRISIDLRREQDELVIAISDDGIGGARLSGFGLAGLADRLAVHGGRLQVDSPPRAGTTITARIAG